MPGRELLLSKISLQLLIADTVSFLEIQPIVWREAPGDPHCCRPAPYTRRFQPVVGGPEEPAAERSWNRRPRADGSRSLPASWLLWMRSRFRSVTPGAG